MNQEEGICALVGRPFRLRSGFLATPGDFVARFTEPCGALDSAAVLRVFRKSAKGAAARRQGGKELTSPFGGALDTAAVLRVFRKSAKGAAARRQGGKELTSPFGGALDTAAVLRVFLKVN